ncbi:hypothetical protein BKA70DRAFT_1442155 [Coprinopsis sp. MPI-PUGE-AT-0042]|nr:hypothetical protein BKA70DRAFT_1442155 [Coprinopsis sp. MPI-PUGE-AT-0042]
MSSPSVSGTPSRPPRERNALLHGRFVRVVLLSDLDDDINPLQFDDVAWEAWNNISPDDQSFLVTLGKPPSGPTESSLLKSGLCVSDHTSEE